MTITLEWIPETARRGVRESRSGAVAPGGSSTLTALLSGASGGRGGDQLLPLVLGKPAPDSIGLMHLKRMAPTFQKSGATRTDRFGLGLATGPGRSAFAFRVEEIRAGHAPACGVELPVPHVGVRSRKTPGIGHCNSSLDLVCPGHCAALRAETRRWGVQAQRRHRTCARGTRGRTGIADDLTIDRSAIMIKTVRYVVLPTLSAASCTAPCNQGESGQA